VGLINKAVNKVESQENPPVKQEIPPEPGEKEEKAPAQKEMLPQPNENQEKKPARKDKPNQAKKKEENLPAQQEIPPRPEGKKRTIILIGTLLLVVTLLVLGYLFSVRPAPEVTPKGARPSISARKRQANAAAVSSVQKTGAGTKEAIAEGEKTISDEKADESLASKETVKEDKSLAGQEEKTSVLGNKPPVETAEGQIAETKKEPGTIKSTIEQPSEPVLTSGVTKEKESPGAVTLAKDEKKPPEYNPDETFPTEEKETAAEGVTLSYATDLKNWLAERSLTVTQRSDSKAQKYYRKGVSQQRQGKLNQAIGSYRRALSFNPDHVQANLNLATAYLQGGRFKEAEQKLIYLYALKPNDCKTLFNLGLLLYQMEEFPSAEVKLKRLLELDPLHLEANLLLGSVYEERGEIRKALESYLKAYQINSLDPDVLYHLGRVWDIAGEQSKAVKYYRLFLSALSETDNQLKGAVVDRLKYLVSEKEGE